MTLIRHFASIDERWMTFMRPSQKVVSGNVSMNDCYIFLLAGYVAHCWKDVSYFSLKYKSVLLCCGEESCKLWWRGNEIYLLYCLRRVNVLTRNDLDLSDDIMLIVLFDATVTGLWVIYLCPIPLTINVIPFIISFHQLWLFQKTEFI